MLPAYCATHTRFRTMALHTSLHDFLHGSPPRTIIHTAQTAQNGTAQAMLLRAFVLVCGVVLVAMSVGFVGAPSLLAQQPVIGGATDLTTQIDFPTVLPITITDESASQVTFSATSSDPNLIQPRNITVSAGTSGGTMRAVTIRPSSGFLGSAVISLTATNRLGQSSTVRFTVNVVRPNEFEPPRITYVEPIELFESQNIVVPLVISDANTGTLILSARSANTVLIPDTSISINRGGNANRVLVFTPAATQTGITTIRVTATNQNGFTSFRDIQVIVKANPILLPPIVGSPGTLVTLAGRPVSGNFDVQDTDVNSVQVFGLSSNPALIPEANIRITGTGSNRTVTVTPSGTLTGTANIILSAFNSAMLNARAGFQVIVLPADGSPVLGTIENLQISRNSAGMRNFQAFDLNPSTLRITAISSSNPGLLPLSSIFFGAGTGGQFSRTVTVVPTTGQSGSSVITVQATNQQGLTATTTFVVTVVSPPVITGLQAIRTTRNTPVSVPFTISDGNVNTVRLVTASGNTTLLPDAGITITGTGANRVLRVAPGFNQIGQTTITLTATNDFNLSETVIIPVTVTPPGTPPVLSQIQNLTTPQNVPAVASFTVTDVNPSGVTFSATSSNPTVIPSGNIFFGGAGANRVVFIAPALNQLGTSTITITATNQDGFTAQTTFMVTVVPPPFPPTLQPILALVTRKNIPVSAQFLVSDMDLGSLQFSAVSSNPAVVVSTNVFVSGFGTTRTVTVLPNPEATGRTTITLTVRNSQGLTATSVFTVTVIAPPTISAIPTIFIPRNGVGTHQFTVADDNVNSLVFSFTSSNPTLIPPQNVAVSGTGTTRTLTIRPAADLVGNSVMTMTVTNQDGLPTTVAFLVVVAAPPEVSEIPDLVTLANTPVSANFRVNDDNLKALQFAAVSADQRLIPLQNIVVTGEGFDRKITLTPGLNQLGTTMITLVVSNGVAQITRMFRVTVVPPERCIPQPVTPTTGTVTLIPFAADQFDFTSIRFDWLPITCEQGAVFYNLDVTPDSTFNWIPFRVVATGSNTVISGFEPERIYYWRVRSQVGTPSGIKFGAWSPVYSFRTRLQRLDSLPPLPGGFLTNGSPNAAADAIASNPKNKSTIQGRITAATAGYAQYTDPQSGVITSADGIVRMSPNAPNPFSESTRIDYDIAEPMNVQLYVVDVLGRRVAELASGEVRGGRYSVTFSARGLPAGAYTCVLQTPKHQLRGQMTVIR